MRPGALLVAIAFLAFIGLGLPDAVIGIAWPSIRDEFRLLQSGLGAILFAGGTGYFIASFVSGRLTQAIGVGGLLVLSSALVTIGLFGYALAPFWIAFLACSAIIGLGSGAIDAALNGYAANVFSARQVNLLHASYGLGAMLGPLILTAMLAQGWSWRWGYAAVGAVLAGMTLAFALTQSSWRTDSDSAGQFGHAPVSMITALRQPLVWLQAVLFFVYAGIEVTAGQWSYTIFVESRGLAPALAGALIGLYWGVFTLGRVISGFVVERVGVPHLTRLATIVIFLASLVFAFAPPYLGAAGLLLLGLALAPMFPGLMAETPGRLGPAVANHAVGFQVSATILGIVGLPSLSGALAALFGLEIIPIVVIAASLALLALHEALLALADRRRIPSPHLREEG